MIELNFFGHFCKFHDVLSSDLNKLIYIWKIVQITKKIIFEKSILSSETFLFFFYQSIINLSINYKINDILKKNQISLFSPNQQNSPPSANHQIREINVITHNEDKIINCRARI